MAEEDLKEVLLIEGQARMRIVKELMVTRKLVLDIVKIVREHRATGYHANLILGPALGAVERIMMGDYLSEQMRNDYAGDDTKGFTREFIEKYLENQRNSEGTHVEEEVEIIEE